MADINAYVAEFVGTFILVFTVGCNVVGDSGAFAGLSIALSLMVGIYALAPVSGANFNPAVSVTLGITGYLPWPKVAIYSVVQIVAGMTAGLAYHLLYGEGFPLGPGGGHLWAAAGMCELLYTFMLCFVVLNTACSAANAGKRQFYGLSIGFVIVAGAYGAGAVSGGCFNPAVALGIEAGSLGFSLYAPLYVACEIAGAGLAAALFKVVRPDAFEEASKQAAEAGLKAPPAELPAKVASEVVGTYILVLTVGLNVLGESKAGAFSIAASLMCMIFALGDVSGAHFNPAVTTAILAIKGCSPMDAGIYVGAQVLGGVLAAVTYVGIYAGQSFALGPKEDYGLGEVAVAEAFFTFVLCFVVLSVACSPSAAKGNYSEIFGLAIGSCVTVGGFAIGGISGGSLNPAVSLGIAAGDAIGASNFIGIVKEGLPYCAFEIIGAALAAGVYFATHAPPAPTGEKEGEEAAKPLTEEPAKASP